LLYLKTKGQKREVNAEARGKTMSPTPVIVPGLHGSCAAHWQAIWKAEYPNSRWVQQRDWESPDCAEWMDTLDSVVMDCPGPVVIIAHSLGCMAFSHWAAFAGDRVRLKVKGGFLVAPADVERENTPREIRSFAPAPRCSLPVPTMLIASENDPCISLPAAMRLAVRWKSIFVNAGPAGHINVASGHGPWPMGKTLLNGFLRDLAAPVLERGRKLR
jgi:predicted alpha/beta hydrolase family esterase